MCYVVHGPLVCMCYVVHGPLVCMCYVVHGPLFCMYYVVHGPLFCMCYVVHGLFITRLHDIVRALARLASEPSLYIIIIDVTSLKRTGSG